MNTEDPILTQEEDKALRLLVSLLGLPDAAERRRYAVLQAAATIAAPNEDSLVKPCVDFAEELLAEIESREKREKAQ